MRHTLSEVMRQPCTVFNCDLCRNDTAVDEDAMGESWNLKHYEWAFSFNIALKTIFLNITHMHYIDRTKDMDSYSPIKSALLMLKEKTF